MRTALGVLFLLVTLTVPAAARGQAGSVESAVSLFQQVRTVPNVVYFRANGWEGRLDIYAQRSAGPVPTVIYIHGGGWVGGNKESNVLNLTPFLAMGYSVVNVGYRLANISLAPAAVEDCRCALRWVLAHAKDYGFDPERIVVAGVSAGGHLALMTAMAPTSAGFDRTCNDPVGPYGPFGPAEPRVRAVVNFFGIADVEELIDGPNRKPFPYDNPYAMRWIGNQPHREELARAVSPLTYVRAGLPPTISVHGDADPSVPYKHSVRLHQGLTKAGVRNELVTVPGGGHGGFSNSEWQRAFAAIQGFLRQSLGGEGTSASAGSRK